MTDLEILANVPENADADALAAYLDEACGDDQALRAKVEALLETRGKEGAFMSAKPIDDPAAFEIAPVRPLELAGTVVGNYKLLEQKSAKAGSGSSSWPSNWSRFAGGWP